MSTCCSSRPIARRWRSSTRGCSRPNDTRDSGSSTCRPSPTPPSRISSSRSCSRFSCRGSATSSSQTRARCCSLDRETDELVARAALGIEEEVVAGVRIPIGGGFAGRVAATKQPVIIDNLATFPVLNPILREKGIESMLGVPLLDRRRRDRRHARRVARPAPVHRRTTSSSCSSSRSALRSRSSVRGFTSRRGSSTS